MCLHADTTLTNNKDIINKLVKAGWNYKEEYVSSLRNGYKPPTIGVFKRETKKPKNNVFVTKKNNVTNENTEGTQNTAFPNGGERHYGSPILSFAP